MNEPVHIILKTAEHSIVWIGISVDEAARMKESNHSRITHRWPLIDLRISRHDCLMWLSKNGYPTPPRSACSYCPYHSDNEWRRLQKDEPEAFASAVDYEKRLQLAFTQVARLTGTPFLHRSMQPLDTVDFSTDERQLNMFNNECEGMCGV